MKKPRKPVLPTRTDNLHFADCDGDVSFSAIIKKIGKFYFDKEVTLKEIVDKYGEDFLNTMSIEYRNEIDWDPYDSYSHVQINIIIDNPNYDEELKQYDEKMLKYNKQLLKYNNYQKSLKIKNKKSLFADREDIKDLIEDFDLEELEL
jgi:hypothetical protein